MRYLSIALLSCLTLFSFQISVVSAQSVVKVETVFEGLQNPWGLAFLPDGRQLVTEREGTMRILDNGRISEPLSGLPDIWISGQGGLLDVALSPNFMEDRILFFSFSQADGFKGHTAIARAKLEGNRLSDVKVILRQYPSVSGGRHFGSRIVPMNDGTLMITFGDRGEADLAQETDGLIGKVVRIHPDGSIPNDNPFVGKSGYAPEIYSIGHRNPQGAARDAEGRFWTVSHGARGGDEINRPQAGKNYGWPIISYGRHYSGFKIGEGTEKPGMEQPLYYWDPSIAPSGMTFYDGNLFPDWQGDIFVGALRGQAVVRIDVENGDITGSEERLIEDEIGRVRTVKTGPDGALWVLTDEDPGGLYRLVPAN